VLPDEVGIDRIPRFEYIEMMQARGRESGAEADKAKG